MIQRDHNNPISSYMTQVLERDEFDLIYFYKKFNDGNRPLKLRCFRTDGFIHFQSERGQLQIYRDFCEYRISVAPLLVLKRALGRPKWHSIIDHPPMHVIAFKLHHH